LVYNRCTRICWYFFFFFILLDNFPHLGDGAIFDRSIEFVEALPPGYWILGDSAFSIRPGQLVQKRKKNELLPTDENRACFQIELERFCGKICLASEWGVKDLKRSWLVLFSELPSDDDVFCLSTWRSVIFLHNLQTCMMRVGQMGSVWHMDTQSDD